jgi:hypothetical protein
MFYHVVSIHLKEMIVFIVKKILSSIMPSIKKPPRISTQDGGPTIKNTSGGLASGPMNTLPPFPLPGKRYRISRGLITHST